MSLALQHKVFYLLVLKEVPELVDQVFSMIPQSVRDSLSKLHGELSKHDSKIVKKVAESELAKLSSSKNKFDLLDVHNDWILEALLSETPEMIALVLSHLPGERASEILDHLPQDILNSLPSVNDTFQLPEMLNTMLRQRFVHKFPKISRTPQTDQLQFNDLALLPSNVLHKVFSRLGYQEVALGLKGIQESTRLKVVSRLSPQDRKIVEEYWQRLTEVSSQRVKKAQEHLLSQNINARMAERFIKDLGYLIFAKSMLQDYDNELQVILRKFSKKEALALEHAVHAHWEENTSTSVLGYQEDVIRAAKSVLGGV